nr:hypothetical protein MBKG4397_8210 [Mycoplasmopsis bovis]
MLYNTIRIGNESRINGEIMKNKAIYLYNSQNLISALDELREMGLITGQLTKNALIEYIRKNYPQVAKKHNL